MQTSQSPAATASQQAREPPRQGQGDRERTAANTIAATDQPGRKLAHLRPFDGTFGIPGAAPPEHAPRRGRRIIRSKNNIKNKSKKLLNKKSKKEVIDYSHFKINYFNNIIINIFYY